jgi:hypothetical protein
MYMYKYESCMSHVYEILRHNINYRLNASFTFHNVKVAEFVSIDVMITYHVRIRISTSELKKCNMCIHGWVGGGGV